MSAVPPPPPNVPDPSIPRTIVRLEVDSYKRLRAAVVVPSPTGLVLVRGRNAQGKSSLIESMLDGLGVEKADLPIRAGEHTAEVELELGEGTEALVVRKRWTRDSAGTARPVLTIEACDGSKVASPAAVLKTLRGHLADPVAFLDMTPDEQVKTVLGVLGLDERLRALEMLAQGHYDRRRDLGRDADRLEKAAAEIASEVQGLPMPALGDGVDQLAAELQAAKDHNARLAAAAVRRDEAERAGKALAVRIADLQKAIAQCEAEKVAAAEAWKRASAELRESTPIDVAPIVEAMRAHEAASKHAGKIEIAHRTAAEAQAARSMHAAADADLEAVRAQIAELLGSARFPVDGMSYDHEARTLTIGGIPFSQASQAERLRASMMIAMAGSPSIRVIFAREGSLLDDDARRQFAELAAAAGFQAWLEVVDSNPQGAGLWIEDGEVYQNGEVQRG